MSDSDKMFKAYSYAYATLFDINKFMPEINNRVLLTSKLIRRFEKDYKNITDAMHLAPPTYRTQSGGLICFADGNIAVSSPWMVCTDSHKGFRAGVSFKISLDKFADHNHLKTSIIIRHTGDEKPLDAKDAVDITQNFYYLIQARVLSQVHLICRETLEEICSSQESKDKNMNMPSQANYEFNFRFLGVDGKNAEYLRSLVPEYDQTRGFNLETIIKNKIGEEFVRSILMLIGENKNQIKENDREYKLPTSKINNQSRVCLQLKYTKQNTQFINGIADSGDESAVSEILKNAALFAVGGL